MFCMCWCKKKKKNPRLAVNSWGLTCETKMGEWNIYWYTYQDLYLEKQKQIQTDSLHSTPTHSVDLKDQQSEIGKKFNRK